MATKPVRSQLNHRYGYYEHIGGTGKMALYTLVKLYEMGYTPVPVFDTLECVDGYDLEDHPDWHNWDILCASNGFPACTVWMEIYTGPVTKEEVSWVLVWRPRPEWEREKSLKDLLGRFYFLSGGSLPPICHKAPDPDQLVYPHGSVWLKDVDPGRLAKDGWDKSLGIKAIRGEKGLERLDLRKITERIKELRKLNDISEVFGSYEIGLSQKTGIVIKKVRRR